MEFLIIKSNFSVATLTQTETIKIKLIYRVFIIYINHAYLFIRVCVVIELFQIFYFLVFNITIIE